jgi:opacity protein-like surface antigen
MTGQPLGTAWPDTHTNQARVLGEGSGAGVALGAGIGLDTALGKSFFVGAEYRYEYLGSVDYSANALGQSLGASMKGSTNLLNFSAKLGYKF